MQENQIMYLKKEKKKGSNPERSQLCHLAFLITYFSNLCSASLKQPFVGDVCTNLQHI